MKSWLPLMIQTVALIAGGLAWSTAQEHRITIIEETLKAQSALLEQQTKTQQLMIDQLRTTQKLLDRVETLEEFWHGQMSQDEAQTFYRQRTKR